jgi:hypothetical protein
MMFFTSNSKPPLYSIERSSFIPLICRCIRAQANRPGEQTKLLSIPLFWTNNVRQGIVANMHCFMVLCSKQDNVYLNISIFGFAQETSSEKTVVLK